MLFNLTALSLGSFQVKSKYKNGQNKKIDMGHLTNFFTHPHQQNLPPKRTTLPPELFDMKELPPGGEEEEEDDDEEQKYENREDTGTDGDLEVIQSEMGSPEYCHGNESSETHTYCHNG